MSANKLLILDKQPTLPIEWESHAGPAVIGKDILELFSGSMYIDPMSIFREYIQNAADSIDEACRNGMLGPKDRSRVEIKLTPLTRTVTIRDNGTGLPHNEFVERLIAIGGSKKKGTEARGFRGIGRLAGLGYCQELIFRSRVKGSSRVSELRWDCRQLRALLRDATFQGDLAAIINQTSKIGRVKSDNFPERFFEVELCGVVRHGNDQLLNSNAVEAYLAEVAPVPFAPEFRFGSMIVDLLRTHLLLNDIEIYINDSEHPVYRPHRNNLPLGESKSDSFTELQPIHIPAVDGGVAAAGWILHHGYIGSLPQSAPIRGLRTRSGNMQIGAGDILQGLYSEPRFNGWTVAEVHVLDKRLVPNGRRDHFEQNVHLRNLENYLSPYAREISSRCRTNSAKRKLMRDFNRNRGLIDELIEILEQGGLNRSDRAGIANKIQQTLDLMERITNRNTLDNQTKLELTSTLVSLRNSLTEIIDTLPTNNPLAHFPAGKRRAYEKIIGLIYECSSNQMVAKTLVDKVIAKLTE